MAIAKYSRYYTHIEPVIKNHAVKSYGPYIFSFISIIIFILFALRPTVSTISNLQKEIQDKRTILSRLEEKAKTLDLAKQNWDNLGEDKKTKIEQAIPNSANITNLITNLQSTISTEASISALQIQPVTIYDKNNNVTPLALEKISFSFNTQGDYQNLLTTLDNLKKSPRIVKIDSLTVSRQEDDPINLSVSGTAYFIR